MVVLLRCGASRLAAMSVLILTRRVVKALVMVDMVVTEADWLLLEA